MASSSRKKKKNEQRPHFFKIVLADSISQNKLAIPRKFVQMHGDDLSSPVKLKVPIINGVKWKVEIVRSEGEIWLQKGWREFAEYYSVLEGSFLVFEYEKSNLEFNVIIFDKTASEIDYPVVDLDQEQGEIGRQRVTKDLSFSNGHEAKEAPKKNTTSVNPSFQATISSACLRSCVVCVPASIVKNINQETKYAKLKVKNRCWTVKLIIHQKFRSGHLSAGWSEFARENSLKAGDFCIFELINSNNDQTLLMNVSIVRGSGRCLIPNGVDSEVEELQVPKVEETTFEIPDEGFGQFSSSRNRLSSSQPRKKMKMVENFPKKTRKEVKKEDEGGLAYQKNMVNKILRKKKPHLTLEENTLDQNPTFQFAIRHSHVCPIRSRPDIPAGFARKYMKRNDGDVVLNVMDGKTWSVKYCRRQFCGQARTKFMCCDWKKFVQGNRLQVGDTCSFELIDPDNRIFRVIISKGRERGNKSRNAFIIKST